MWLVQKERVKSLRGKNKYYREKDMGGVKIMHMSQLGLRVMNECVCSGLSCVGCEGSAKGPRVR